MPWPCLYAGPAWDPTQAINPKVPKMRKSPSPRIVCDARGSSSSSVGAKNTKFGFGCRVQKSGSGLLQLEKGSRGRPQVAGYNQRKLAKSLHTGAGRLWQITQSPNCYQALFSCNRMGFHQEILTADQNPESISSVTDGIINNLRC